MSEETTNNNPFPIDPGMSQPTDDPYDTYFWHHINHRHTPHLKFKQFHITPYKEFQKGFAPVIPEVYWNVWSPEQRIAWIMEQIARLQGWQDYVATTLNEFSDALMCTWQMFRDNMTDEWLLYQKELNDEWLAYQEQLNNEWNTYKTELTEAWEAYQEQLNNEWNTYKTELTEAWEAYQEQLNSEWSAYKNELTEAWEAYKIEVNNYLSEYDAKFEEFKTEVNNYLSEYDAKFEEFTTEVNNYLSEYDAKFEEFKTEVNNYLSEYDAKFEEFTTEVNNYLSEYDAKFEEFTTEVNNLYKTFQKEIEDRCGSMEDEIHSAIDDFTEELESADKRITTLENCCTEVESTIEDLKKEDTAQDKRITALEAEITDTKGKQITIWEGDVSEPGTVITFDTSKISSIYDYLYCDVLFRHKNETLDEAYATRPSCKLRSSTNLYAVGGWSGLTDSAGEEGSLNAPSIDLITVNNLTDTTCTYQGSSRVRFVPENYDNLTTKFQTVTPQIIQTHLTGIYIVVNTL